MANITSIETLKNANWGRMRREVDERIIALRDIVFGLQSSPINDKIANDLIIPAVTILADFIIMIEIGTPSPYEEKKTDDDDDL